MSDSAPGYALSDEHNDFRAMVADFAAAEIAPYAEQWDREHTFPLDAVKKMGAIGLFGLHAPEEYGGAGDFTSLCVAIEEIGRVDQSLGITLEAGVGLGINPIASFGTPAQKEEWLPNLIAGRALAGFGLTEPEAGSDAGATRTRADLVDGEWVVNGAKQFITNSGTDITSVVTVTARTGVREDGKPEISSLLLPTDSEGLTVEPPYRKLGWHASDTHPLTFTHVRVPEANLLGERGKGFAQFLAILDDGRVAIAALALGCIRACRDLAAAYALERTTFGVPIGRKQGVAFQIADLDVMAHTADLLVYSAAALRDRGGSPAEFRRAAAIAKLYCTEAAVTATRTATQVFGGYGFMEEYPVARFYRDAKVLEIGEGTSEVQRMVIARGLGLPVE
ncbi:acyl-CoA dehydrogenase family protein [Microlunatus panaciterrae]|uniref:Butyryl-CoA dehydrogenase n=1 Tax=Microlunatus panaciterrae TaxID=400768 RepID=A0ABS2RL55_9ACTN|nr:acyl-CoA dehydrogenase family protein [Microlunatus panaciterrae]MBM7799727.1 butyryl-CoA dehydrogenase [Microlunatus panaciterrae]